VQIQGNALGYITSRLQLVKSVVGVQTDTGHVNRFCEGVEKSLLDVTAALIGNADGLGFSESTDATTATVIVRKDCEGDHVTVPVNESCRRSTISLRTKADGSLIWPMIPIQRKIIERELYQIGYRPDRHLIAYREGGFISRILFGRWVIRSSSLTWTEPERNSCMRERCKCDWMGACATPWRICGSVQVSRSDSAHAAPHSPNQTQHPDLGIFAVPKRETRGVRAADGFNPQTDELRTIPAVSVGLRRKQMPGVHVRQQVIMACVDRPRVGDVRHWHFSKKRIPASSPPGILLFGSGPAEEVSSICPFPDMEAKKWIAWQRSFACSLILCIYRRNGTAGHYCLLRGTRSSQAQAEGDIHLCESAYHRN
jgi:hypothetical protein